MKNILRSLFFAALLCGLCGSGARAMENDMLKVALKYGADAMFSASLQNYDGAGRGFAFGYFDGARAFVPLGVETDEEKITVSADGAGDTGVVVTATESGRVLFCFDGGGERALGVLPRSLSGEKPVTWFQGFRYYGGFEYPRAARGGMSVINVVNVEDYVKGCVGWEIGGDKPLEAIKAQAVCARTYAAMQTRHRALGFDVCATEDCQVYRGLAAANEATDRAVDETAGVYLYYNGAYAEAYYYSSNGGASEDAANVWGAEVAYLKGKADPYEAYIAPRVAHYNWTAELTRSEIEARLAARGLSVGTLQSVYVSEYTPTGNVRALTFAGTSGTKTVYRETCRTLLGLRSMRFTVGGDAATYYVNGVSETVTELQNAYVISGDGTVARCGAAGRDAYAITSGGTVKLAAASARTGGADSVTFIGSGWGHNVGMSQWGAAAMAELGYGYREILQFYYTGVTIE